ncbi:J domain-containing protein [Sphingobium sp. HBC34]|uniref:J domain-containing protein n=1 Tax=Sphingobium cyanobacteriorum TaxID=3063954 RepID=A0ABT8ZP81_9SPHN|nr:J domain-containing protein [Sphingobium sp. HBC34]MDO7835794.1 J domain-containing protein [Sphingobium sp. HBC34]
MGALALLLAALAIWLIWTGRLQRMTAKDGMALGAALVGAVLAAKGKPVLGAPLLIGAALFFARQGNRRAKARQRPAAPIAPPPADDVARARALLGVAPDADAQAIRAAHRRLIASVHPDKGGTEALAAQINAARDLLLDDRAQG